jgi:hypothetical protein
MTLVHGHLFSDRAIVPLVVNPSSGEIMEAAMVGKDGVVDAFATLGGKIPVNRAIVQLAGPALTCKVSELRSAVLQSQSSLFRHEQAVYAQAGQSAAAWQPTTMPMASSFARLSRHGQSAVHPGISR